MLGEHAARLAHVNSAMRMRFGVSPFEDHATRGMLASICELNMHVHCSGLKVNAGIKRKILAELLQ